jgi:hypothetical protein
VRIVVSYVLELGNNRLHGVGGVRKVDERKYPDAPVDPFKPAPKLFNRLPAALTHRFPSRSTVTNMATGQGTQTRTATLTVNPPALQVSPSMDIAASGTHGGPFAPSSFNYALSATYGTVKYSITNVPSWLSVSPSSGTLTTSATTVTFKVNSSADKLTPNTYVSNVNFINTTGGQGNTARVATLTVYPKQYNLTVSAKPSADGAVSGSGTFAEGSLVTVTATPNGSHSFVNWTQNTKVVSTSASYTFTMPSASTTLTAHFK